jgi:hypothetical protein
MDEGNNGILWTTKIMTQQIELSELIFPETEDACWQNGECILTFSDELDAEDASIQADLAGFKFRVEADRLILTSLPKSLQHTTLTTYAFDSKEKRFSRNVWNRFQWTHASSFVPEPYTWQETKTVYPVGFWRGLLGWLLCMPRRIWSQLKERLAA